MPIEAHALIKALVATVSVAGITAVLGWRGLRRPHVASALATTVALVYTVYLAEVLGRQVTIPRPVLIFHLTFANLATLAFAAVAVTGVRMFRRDEPLRRRWHRRAVIAFLVLTVMALASGSYMLSVATPKATSVELRAFQRPR